MLRLALDTRCWAPPDSFARMHVIALALAGMANDFGVSPEEAREQLDILESDRAHMADRVPTPWGLMTAAGAALAWFVADAATANPGPQYEAGIGYLLAVAVLCLVAYFVRRDTGIRPDVAECPC